MHYFESQQAFINEEYLPPTKIKRKYKCPEAGCSLGTTNPRAMLRHRQEEHKHKIKIVLCPMCLYACQYTQKLKRHIELVHTDDYQSEPLDLSIQSNKGNYNN